MTFITIAVIVNTLLLLFIISQRGEMKDLKAKMEELSEKIKSLLGKK